MEHCRGFVRGTLIGCAAGPVVGFWGGIALTMLYPSLFFPTEFGSPLLYALGFACMGPPVGSFLGGFVGSIIDFRTHRDVRSSVAMTCMAILVTCFAIPLVMMFF